MTSPSPSLYCMFINPFSIQLAEKQGVVCRDDSYQGLIFYPNFFKDYEVSFKASK